MEQPAGLADFERLRMNDNRRLLLDDPWTVDSVDFPSEVTTREKLLFALNYAVLAPSILNTQPWRFRVTDRAMEIFADQSRLLPITDPHGREMTISCGAALLNVRVALCAFGFHCEPELLPDKNSPELLARVTVSGPEQGSEPEQRLRNAIVSRRTNRGELLNRPLPPELLAALSVAAVSERSTLEIAAAPSVKSSVADLIVQAQGMLLENPDYQREMGDWVGNRMREARPSASSGTSIAGRTPTLPNQPELRIPTAASATRMFSRNPEALERLGQHLTAAPVIALLTTGDDTPASWMAAGQGLQRALLEATAGGACASFLNAPIEVPSLRPRLGELFGTKAVPQIMLRLGYGREIRPESRRPTSAVLESSV
jgi:hypothetical protein